MYTPHPTDPRGLRALLVAVCSKIEKSAMRGYDLVGEWLANPKRMQAASNHMGEKATHKDGKLPLKWNLLYTNGQYILDRPIVKYPQSVPICNATSHHRVALSPREFELTAEFQRDVYCQWAI